MSGHPSPSVIGGRHAHGAAAKSLNTRLLADVREGAVAVVVKELIRFAFVIESAEGVAYCDEHDIANYGTFLRSERTSVLEKTGHWDEALALSQEILDHAAPSPVARLCPMHRIGAVLARRGDPRARDYLSQAIAAADMTGEPQQIVPVRLSTAESYWLEGRGTRGQARGRTGGGHGRGKRHLAQRCGGGLAAADGLPPDRAR